MTAAPSPELQPGRRYRSTTCSTEVIVVRGEGAVDLRCGGRPMVELDAATPRADAGGTAGAPEPGFDGGTLTGKRYATPDGTVELLCTRPGTGSLSVGPDLLAAASTRVLPSSD